MARHPRPNASENHRTRRDEHTRERHKQTNYACKHNYDSHHVFDGTDGHLKWWAHALCVESWRIENAKRVILSSFTSTTGRGSCGEQNEEGFSWKWSSRRGHFVPTYAYSFLFEIMPHPWTFRVKFQLNLGWKNDNILFLALSVTRCILMVFLLVFPGETSGKSMLKLR